MSAARRDAQWRMDSVNFSEKLAKKAEESKIREEKSVADMEERRVASNKRRIEVREAIDIRTDFEKLQDQIDAISTPAMKLTIATAFANDGLFAYMISPEVQLVVQLEGTDLLNHLVHDINDEPEISGDDLSAFSRVGSDNGMIVIPCRAFNDVDTFFTSLRSFKMS